MTREDYCCIRCGYSTDRKSSMRKHLYDVKKECPATKNKLVLTDEIKKDIINNRKHLLNQNFHITVNQHVAKEALSNTLIENEPSLKGRGRTVNPQNGAKLSRSRSKKNVSFADIPLKSRIGSNTIGCTYIYQIQLKYKSREEALNFLGNYDEIPTIICTDDLKGQTMFKIGKTDFTAFSRQVDYLSYLSDIYILDISNTNQYDIDFLIPLSEVENAIKSKFKNDTKITLMQLNGQLLHPNEVFLIDDFNVAKSIVRDTINELRDYSKRVVNTEPEYQLKQIEAEIKLKDLNLKSQTIEMFKKHSHLLPEEKIKDYLLQLIDSGN